MTREIVFLRDSDIRSLLDEQGVLEAVERAYVALATGRSMLSRPRSLEIGAPVDNPTSTLVKVASDRSYVATRVITTAGQGGPGSRLLLLVDSKSGEFRGLIDESTSSGWRVGAQVAVAARHLSRTDPALAVLVGTGRLAGPIARMLATALPSLQTLLVVSRNRDRLERFVRDLDEHLPLDVKAVSSLAGTGAEAEIIVTATSAAAPVVTSDHVHPGTLVITVGAGQELEEKVVLEASKVFLDDIEFCARMGSLSKLLQEERIAWPQLSGTIGEVIGQMKRGRETQDETIVAVPQGLAAADLGVAAWLLDQARLRSCGINLSM